MPELHQICVRPTIGCRFTAQCCELDPKALCDHGELYKAYCAYLEQTASGNPISSKAFGAVLQEKKLRRGTILRHGIRLNKHGMDYREGHRRMPLMSLP